ncbi:hypothetical protein MTR_5g011660 [Medicago truncatula]|uniref:AT-hook motif nuclear-localized protein n=1 Tax=Medicago truncatula TaxID=3880 RepID=G7KG57_MEDTR|nr:hypothetical protein MTR_5g011660 [Medicago truncatula]
MAGASNSGASDTPRDYHAAPRTGIPAFAGGSAADSTSQGGIPPMQTVAQAKKKRSRPRKYGPDESFNLAKEEMLKLQNIVIFIIKYGWVY